MPNDTDKCHPPDGDHLWDASGEVCLKCGGKRFRFDRSTGLMGYMLLPVQAAVNLDEAVKKHVENRYDWPDDLTKLVWRDYNFGHLIDEMRTSFAKGWHEGRVANPTAEMRPDLSALLKGKNPEDLTQLEQDLMKLIPTAIPYVPNYPFVSLDAFDKLAKKCNTCIEALEAIAALPKGSSITDLDGWYAKRKAEAVLAQYEASGAKK